MDHLLNTLNYVVPLVTKEAPKVVESSVTSGGGNNSSLVLRVAGVSGAAAVLMGAYGAHGFKNKKEALKLTFETGNRYHLLHSIVLLSAPLTNHPHLVSSLLLGGMVLFSGSCYACALKEGEGWGDSVKRVTPVGGMMLVAAWLCMAL